MNKNKKSRSTEKKVEYTQNPTFAENMGKVKENNAKYGQVYQKMISEKDQERAKEIYDTEGKDVLKEMKTYYDNIIASLEKDYNRSSKNLALLMSMIREANKNGEVKMIVPLDEDDRNPEVSLEVTVNLLNNCRVHYQKNFKTQYLTPLDIHEVVILQKKKLKKMKDAIDVEYRRYYDFEESLKKIVKSKEGFADKS